ncbi:hypothetical protein KO507_04250 [Gilvimarinus agarilyticus]|uniref:hypothetical protein n=1 Tax=unclassified Gilvimarinus TaxID=2642066 RepID=UPI001C084E67|nr:MULTISPECIES: hypothetical protein [unclassified Gilvimarinus]MBU2884976.1 hypothetical protein [Gilvimarinus agarilyticus]MDO6569873.1 hypothetical protein [Gilvimarinus sp. 2_MG-2023]MDO6747086.1 hypothetical protein [Gilvimarinus sp. 1_MG-2023]
MFTFSKRNTLTTLIAGISLAASVSASAAVRYVDGTVESVDYETKSFTIIEAQTGEINTYNFPGRPKIDIDGRKQRSMSALEAGQNVVLRLRTEEKAEEKSAHHLVKGEILEINRSQGLALIRPLNGTAPRVVELPSDVAISGLHSGAGVEDLKEGHLVTLKYTSL